MEWRKLSIFLLPAASVVALIWAVLNFSKVQAESYLLYPLREISYRSMAIFIGTLLFAILSVATGLLAVKTFKQWRGFTAWYLLLTSMSLLFITFILLLNGWVGLRSWAM